MIYELTTPPPGQQCSTPGDGNNAAVRVITPHGANGAGGKTALDFCDLCWPRILGTCRRMSHEIVDTTGSAELLTAEYPHWRIFTSDGGRLYASATLRGPQGTTVYAWLVAALRDEMERAERFAARGLSGVTV